MMVSTSRHGISVASATVQFVLVFMCIMLIGKTEAGIRKYNTKSSKYTVSTTSTSSFGSRLVLAPVVSNHRKSSTNQSMNSSSAYVKYRKNFVKLVENFLLKHIEKALKKKVNVNEPTGAAEAAAVLNGEDGDFGTEYYSAMANDELGTASRLVPKCNQTANCKTDDFNLNISKISSRFRKRLNQAKKNKSFADLFDDSKSPFHFNLS